MEKKYLSLEQNLCSARILLNIFGLVLETQDEINESTKLNILDKNNNQVGIIYFENGIIKIQSETGLGNLNANYCPSEFGGYYATKHGIESASWQHLINFQVEGNLNFSGDMQIDASIDTDSENFCKVHSTIKYIDQNNNKVELKFMDDGYPFNYKARKDGFSEELIIDPWSYMGSFMSHVIRDGKYDNNHLCYLNERVKYVLRNGNDKDHLRIVSCIVENYQTKEYLNELCKSVDKDDLDASAIQKGQLMQQIDDSFSKKIVELINLFKKDNISLLENLIDVAFNRHSSDVIESLFGIDIQKIDYYNGADNLVDAYLGIGENNSFRLKKANLRR